MQGRLYAIGVGPGASDLITVRAARVLGQLDVLFAPAGRKGGDSLALSIVREYLSPHTEIQTCHFPMSGDHEEKTAAWTAVSERLRQAVAQGQQVGFITLGDSMLFSTWVYLLPLLGYPDWVEVVPGITSFSAIAARMRFPLAMEQQSMAVMSCTAPEAELDNALQHHACVVLMKVYGRFPAIKALLARRGLLAQAVLVSDASLPSEQCWQQLDQLADDTPLPYFSTILVHTARE